MNSFCPTCANLLLVEQKEEGLDGLAFVCQTCPFTYEITQMITDSVPLEKKDTDIVFGGDEAWKNVAKIEGVPCPACGHLQAYYKEVQIRSADEPATIFFRCVKCANQWKEG